MKYRPFKAVIALAAGLLFFTIAARATEINVPMNSTLSGFGFSSPYRAQTFIAIDSGFADTLTVNVGPTSDLDFSFRVLITEVAAGPDFHPTNVLFESGPLLVPVFCFCTTPFTLDLGGLGLVPGQTYAIVLDHFVESTGTFKSADTGTSSPGTYPDGHLIQFIPSPFLPSGTRADHFASNNWLVDDRFDLAFRLTFANPPRPVAVDVNPRRCPNRLNVASSGRLPVAILGTPDIDVSTIDVASLRLEGVPPLKSKTKDIGTPFEPFIGKQDAYDCNDLGADGFADLELKFDRQQVVAALGNDIANGDVVALHLTGNFSSDVGGQHLIGEDVVVIKVPRNEDDEDDADELADLKR